MKYKYLQYQMLFEHNHMEVFFFGGQGQKSRLHVGQKSIKAFEDKFYFTVSLIDVEKELLRRPQ